MSLVVVAPGMPEHIIRGREKRETVKQTKWKDGLPPECFTQNSVNVRQCWSVIEIGESIFADNFINLCLGFGLYLWIEHHSKNEHE